MNTEKISLAEAAEFLECSEDRVLKLLRAGEVAGIKAGRDWLIPRAAFLQSVNDMALREAAARRASGEPAPEPVAPPPPPRGRGRPTVDR